MIVKHFFSKIQLMSYKIKQKFVSIYIMETQYLHMMKLNLKMLFNIKLVQHL